MTKFNKNIVLKPDLITFIIYIVLVCLYQGIIDVQDSNGIQNEPLTSFESVIFIAIIVISHMIQEMDDKLTTSISYRQIMNSQTQCHYTGWLINLQDGGRPSKY